MRKRRKRTFSLIISMIICMAVTVLLFIGSVKCDTCGKKLEGKYYTTEYHEPQCLACAGEHYRDSNVDRKKYLQRADNSLRNILLTGEVLFFIAAIICVNLRGKNTVKPTENGYTAGIDNRTRSVILRGSSEYPEREHIRRTVKSSAKKEELVKKTTAPKSGESTGARSVKKSSDVPSAKKSTDASGKKSSAVSTAKKGSDVSSAKKSSDVPSKKSSAGPTAKKSSDASPVKKSSASSTVSGRKSGKKQTTNTR